MNAQDTDPDSTTQSLFNQPGFERFAHIGRDQPLHEALREHPDLFAAAATLVQEMVAEGRDVDALGIARQMLRAFPDDPQLQLTVANLRTRTHWSMKPLWPVTQGGFAVSVALWVGAIAFVRLAPKNSVTVGVAGLWLFYVLYSWLWPGFLRSRMRRRNS